MKKIFLILLIPISCFAWNDAPSCLYDLEVNFFPSDIARQSFDLFYVFQSQWDLILTSLSEEVKAAPKLVKEKARRMKPNPLEYPFDPEKTKELLLEVEYEIFQRVMFRNYFYDLQGIRGMFDYIASKQEKKIQTCFEKKKKTVKKKISK